MGCYWSGGYHRLGHSDRSCGIFHTALDRIPDPNALDYTSVLFRLWFNINLLQLAMEAARHPIGPDPARKNEILEDQKLGLEQPR